jgi:hypothetical protein
VSRGFKRIDGQQLAVYFKSTEIIWALTPVVTTNFNNFFKFKS